MIKINLPLSTQEVEGMSTITSRFTGQVALITGASRGIGLATAQRLVEEGAKVCITGRDPDQLATALNGLAYPDAAVAIAGNANDPEHRSAAIELCVQKFGQLNILVNNVGVNPEFGPTLKVSPKARDRILEMNVLATMDWIKVFADRTPRHLGAAVVNIASVAGVRPAAGIGMYGISKAAVLQMTAQLAVEMAPDIRVNAVAPAVIKTQFSAALYEDKETELERQYPLGRLGRPRDVAAAVAYLASVDASWITGQTLIVDGGLTLLGGV